MHTIVCITPDPMLPPGTHFETAIFQERQRATRTEEQPGEKVCIKMSLSPPTGKPGKPGKVPGFPIPTFSRSLCKMYRFSYIYLRI